MKKLQCEMCGSTDIIKQNGVFVCQSCGMKYSVEDAKKMMIDGVVEVTGSVGIDKTVDLEKWISLARRAKASNDRVTASKYYALIYEQEPTNWESWFYSQYYRLFLEKNNSHNFAKEINDILEAMWQQVDEKDLDDTIKDIIAHLNKLSTLENNEEEDDREKTEYFDFGLFNLLANSFTIIHKRTDNCDDQLITLAMNALKRASSFSNADECGWYTYSSSIEKEQWEDAEFNIINCVDFMIGKKIKLRDKHGDFHFGVVSRKIEGTFWFIDKWAHIYDEFLWWGSKAVCEGIVNCLNRKREYTWVPKSKINEFIDDYNRLINKVKRLKPDFDFPKGFEQLTLPSTDEEIFACIKKDLDILNEEYEKKFNPNGFESYSSLFSCEDSPQWNFDEDEIAEMTLEDIINEYNDCYKLCYEDLMEAAEEIDPQFTFPNLVETNPITISRFVNNNNANSNSGCLGVVLGIMFVVLLSLAL